MRADTQVLEICEHRQTSLKTSIKSSLAHRKRKQVLWDYKKDWKTCPACPDEKGVQYLQATVRQSPWSRLGYSQAYPGFVFHYHSIDKIVKAAPPTSPPSSEIEVDDEDANNGVADAGQLFPMVSYGTGLLDSPQAVAEDVMKSRAVRAHHFAHRYAKVKESLKDRLVWHAGVLLEWDHGRFTTVVELAWFRGVGGYRSKSNW